MKNMLSAAMMMIASPFLLSSHAHAEQEVHVEPSVYMVTFTAKWCPNCKILDPKLAQALSHYDDMQIKHVKLDMTNADTKIAAFDKINGTLMGDVYGDYLGQTGIGILTAADSGEKLGCALRIHSTAEIKKMIDDAIMMTKNQPALQRSGGLGDCPPVNNKVEL